MWNQTACEKALPSMSFLPIFDSKYASGLTSLRAPTFRKAIEHLEQKGPVRPEHGFILVETGCTRILNDEMSLKGDGASTVLWDHFVRHHGGRLLSVDISPFAVSIAKQKTSDQTTVACCDSVRYLNQLAHADLQADLLYLDSFDVDFSDPHPSALHHLKELVAARPLLRDDSLVMVDDHKDGVGKGMYVKAFFNHLGIAPLFEQYQIGFVWKN